MSTKAKENASQQTTALSVYEKIPDTMGAVKQLGLSIAKSQMFGCGNVEQGEVLALSCLVKRLDPLTLAERYHIIQGKLSMKADAMLAGFHDAGGKHKINEYSPDGSDVEFSIDGESLRIRIKWEDAQKEKWPYVGAIGSKLKDNWATPLGRQDMMWARVVSRGVKKLRPSIVAGCYTPEEIGDFETAIPPAGQPAAKSADVEQIMRDAAARRVESTDPAEDRPAVVAIIDQPLGEVVDAEFEVKQDEATTTTTAPATVTIGGQQHSVVLPTKEQATIPPVASTTDAVEFCTGPQSARINDLFLALEMPLDRQQVNRDKFGGGKPTATNRNLTREQADKFIAALERTRDAKAAKLAAEVGGESRMPEGVTSAPSTGPCSQAVVDELKSLVKEMEQVKPGSVAAIKAHMISQGKAKFSDLSAVDAEALRGMLAQRNLEQFFTRSLEPVANGNGNDNGHHGQATETTSEKKVTAA